MTRLKPELWSPGVLFKNCFRKKFMRGVCINLYVVFLNVRNDAYSCMSCVEICTCGVQLMHTYICRFSCMLLCICVYVCLHMSTCLSVCCLYWF